MRTQPNLYEQDFYLCTQEQATTLGAREFEALDIPHLIEELRDLGNTLKNALESDLCQILLHRLTPRSSHKLRARAEEPCAV